MIALVLIRVEVLFISTQATSVAIEAEPILIVTASFEFIYLNLFLRAYGAVASQLRELFVLATPPNVIFINSSGVSLMPNKR